MKKIITLVVAFAIFASATAALAASSSWQVYDVKSNTLYVYSGQSAASPLCFVGVPEDYDGTCVSPSAPGQLYTMKQQVLRYEAEGRADRAATIREAFNRILLKQYGIAEK